MTFGMNERHPLLGLLLAAATLAAAGCSKATAPEAAAPPPVVETAAIEHPGVKAERFDITPATIRRGQPATVDVQLDRASPGSTVTVGWFGPDGWNVADQSENVAGNRASFAAPVASLDKPGRYTAELRAGLDDLAGATLTVTE
jgi:outer membrane receptor protein involved in Fe transport